jgi:HAD superfamily hydrolase (TIGR01509 family)
MRLASDRPRTRAVCFDVDFTLIHPGPTFQGAGYRDVCGQYGVTVDADAFGTAVAAAAVHLEAGPGAYDPEIFIRYTSRIIEGMGGSGPGVLLAARAIYGEWAACHHFEMYEDVPDTIRAVRALGIRIGLISNTERCLSTFAEHFELRDLIDLSLSSADHGFMKPHPSIFTAALHGLGALPGEAVMVGDSISHDIAGALGIGMRGVLVARAGRPANVPEAVPVIQSLRELPALL